MRWGVDLRPEPQYPPPTPIPTLIGIGIGYSVGPYRNRPIATWPSAIMMLLYFVKQLFRVSGQASEWRSRLLGRHSV